MTDDRERLSKTKEIPSFSMVVVTSSSVTGNIERGAEVSIEGAIVSVDTSCFSPVLADPEVISSWLSMKYRRLQEREMEIDFEKEEKTNID